MIQDIGNTQTAYGSGFNIPTAPPAENTVLSEETAVRLKDPFSNPTEYHHFRDDYSKILPWIKMPEYKIPLNPARAEREMLRRNYNIGGICVLLQFLCSQFALILLMWLIETIIKFLNPDVDVMNISDYMSQSSIMSGLNMIIFVTVNSLFAFLGLKWSKTRHPSLMKTRDFNFRYAIEYCVIALAIWVVAGNISTFVEEIFTKFGHSTILDGMQDEPVSGLGIAVETIYACIMAPVTEELFFRGMLLRVFSKANQRFAVFATAFFFGLAHGNLPQFSLAFLLGIFLAHMTLKHGSIIPSIIVHMFINSFVTAASYAPEGGFAEGAINLLLITSFFAGLVLLVIYRKNDRLPSTTPAQARRGLSIACTSPALVISTILIGGVMALLVFNN